MKPKGSFTALVALFQALNGIIGGKKTMSVSPVG